MAAALARLLGAQGQEIEDRAAATHLAIAERVFRAVGPMGAPARVVHDAVATGVHGTIRAALGSVGTLSARAAAQVPDEVLLASPRGRSVVGAVLGLIGSTVRDEEPDLAWPTVLLRDGEVVASSEGPPATASQADELVVLLHGLCETDLAWTLGARQGRLPLPVVLDRPGRDLLVARYNSGLRPAELGAHLSVLLEQLTDGRTPRVVFVGHSMGGLVARAALRTGARDGAAWVQHCDTLVTLGTPHLGAPLERAVEVLVRAGAVAPEVDAITRWFDQRSDGVRDLRHGVDDDSDVAGTAIVAAPLPAHVRLHTVASNLPGWRGTAFGDGLVRPPSAHGEGRRARYEGTRGDRLDVVGSHFDLLHDPAITSHVARLLTEVG